MGRRVRLTPQAHEDVVNGLVAGATQKIAALNAGLSERSFQRYLARGLAAETALRDALTRTDPETRARLDDVQPADLNPEDPDDQALAEELGTYVPEDERRYWHFWHDVENAISRAKMRNLAVVNRAATGYDVQTEKTTTRKYRNGETHTETVVTKTRRFEWTAAAWWLERRFPEEFGRLTRTEITGAGGGPLEVAGPESVEAVRDRGLAAVHRLRAIGAGDGETDVEAG